MRNVRVNVLLVGHQEGELPARRPGEGEADDPAAAQDQRRRTEDALPLRRFGEALEFARPATFMLSPAASYVTGSVLTVDGGLARSL